MKIKVVPIGNSKGIRIPKPVLEQCKIDQAIDMRVEGGSIVLTPARSRPRRGWAVAAERMRQAGDDALLIPDVFLDDVEVDR